jgi:hypothetical protein
VLCIVCSLATRYWLLGALSYSPATSDPSLPAGLGIRSTGSIVWGSAATNTLALPATFLSPLTAAPGTSTLVLNAPVAARRVSGVITAAAASTLTVQLQNTVGVETSFSVMGGGAAVTVQGTLALTSIATALLDHLSVGTSLAVTSPSGMVNTISMKAVSVSGASTLSLGQDVVLSGDSVLAGNGAITCTDGSSLSGGAVFDRQPICMYLPTFHPSISLSLISCIDTF